MPHGDVGLGPRCPSGLLMPRVRFRDPCRPPQRAFPEIAATSGDGIRVMIWRQCVDLGRSRCSIQEGTEYDRVWGLPRRSRAARQSGSARPQSLYRHPLRAGALEVDKAPPSSIAELDTRHIAAEKLLNRERRVEADARPLGVGCKVPSPRRSLRSRNIGALHHLLSAVAGLRAGEDGRVLASLRRRRSSCARPRSSPRPMPGWSPAWLCPPPQRAWRGPSLRCARRRPRGRS